MGWFDKLVGGSVAEPIEAVGTALDSLFTSDEERIDKETARERVKQNPQRWQFLLNLAEAGNRNVFVAGWRPAIGWVCALALFNIFLINPWLQWLTGQKGPELDVATIGALVTSMLGVAALRTSEKRSGVAK